MGCGLSLLRTTLANNPIILQLSNKNETKNAVNLFYAIIEICGTALQHKRRGANI
jgi:hypothetical protein